ncbi:hypothetical protein [Mesoplasma coleopterae]|uniref:Lipoprotein n=1 Tax=Mesoplasma coleopterae TaxID=324078 RepID=A0A2K8P471_9MOLU|nr:hypothetical protein [Mesoplasma coleopterae]ATZ20930.1 hypothetical protein MCOLE_v1c04160 [Mesoplasma coleopterae]AVN63109.1 hypothetical protein CG000_02240 [Mesoplasma coleopterae]
MKKIILIFLIILITVSSCITLGFFSFKAIIFPETTNLSLNLEKESVIEVNVEFHTNDSNNFPPIGENNDKFTLSSPEQINYVFEGFESMKIYKKPVKKTIILDDLWNYFYVKIKHVNNINEIKYTNFSFYNYGRGSAYVIIEELTYKDYFNFNLRLYDYLWRAKEL